MKFSNPLREYGLLSDFEAHCQHVGRLWPAAMPRECREPICSRHSYRPPLIASDSPAHQTEASKVLASVYPEAPIESGAKGHDISEDDLQRLQPRKYRSCGSPSDSIAP